MKAAARKKAAAAKRGRSRTKKPLPRATAAAPCATRVQMPRAPQAQQVQKAPRPASIAARSAPAALAKPPKSAPARSVAPPRSAKALTADALNSHDIRHPPASMLMEKPCGVCGIMVSRADMYQGRYWVHLHCGKHWRSTQYVVHKDTKAVFVNS